MDKSIIVSPFFMTHGVYRNERSVRNRCRHVIMNTIIQYNNKNLYRAQWSTVVESEADRQTDRLII